MSFAFNRLLGKTQARIQPSGITPPSGAYVFCLGSDEAGVNYTLQLGDRAEVTQTADVTGLKLVRFSASLRGASTMPTGKFWLAQWGVDDQVHGHRVLSQGRAETIRDAVINVAGLTGNHDIFFRLVFTNDDAFTPAPAAGPHVVNVSPNTGPKTGGGRRIVIEVDSSTGATGAAIHTGPYTVAFTDFAIDDATHVSGVLPMWPGAFLLADVQVTNASGTGTLAGGFTYRDWLLIDATAAPRAWYLADHAHDNGSGGCDVWPDDSGAGDANRDQAHPGISPPTIVASDADYGGKPAVHGDGTQAFGCPGAWSTPASLPLTIAVVGKTASGASFLADITAGGTGYNMLWRSGTTLEYFNGAVLDAPGIATLAAPHVYLFEDDGVTARLYIDNLTEPVAVGPSCASSAQAYNLFAGDAGVGPINGSMAEAAVLDGILSAGDKANLVDYYNTTRAYGLGVSAPFSPLAVPGARVWYDAAKSTNTGGGTPVLATLPDQTGNGCDAVIPVGFEPFFTAANADFNGLATMDMAPAADTRYVETRDLGIAPGDPFTYVLVADGDGDYFMSSYSTNVAVYSGGGALATGDAGTHNLVSTGASRHVPQVFIAVFDGVSSRFYTSAKTPVTGDAGAQALTGTPNRIVRFGMYGSGTLSVWSQDGSTAHGLVYTGALSQEQCEYLLDGFGPAAGIAIGP